MLKRLTINMLLKSVIVAMAAAVVVQLSLGAWGSWNRYNNASRIAAATDASAYLFAALHNLRVDRSSTTRDLATEKISTSPSALLKKTRDAEMPALKSGIEALKLADFPERATSVAALTTAVAKLETLQKDSLAAMAQPRASRPSGLSQDFSSHVTGMIDMLDRISSQLTRAVKLEDAYIDQLLDLKQLAWVARNAAGDASVMISNGLGGLPLPKDAMMVYTNHLARLDTAWAAVKEIAAGMPVPKALTDAIARAQQEFLGPEFTELRLKNLKAVIAGEKVDVKADDWSSMSVAKLSSLLVVAERALDVAKDYAVAQRGNALQSLAVQLGLLVLALVVAGGIILMISRRVTGPLFSIQQTMLRLASGEFNVTLPCIDRKDEIGDVANAVERFKVLAVEKAQQQSAELIERQKADAAKQAEAARVEAERASKAAQEEAERQKLAAEAEAATQARIAAERARIAEEQAHAVNALGEGLQRLADGDLTFRLPEQFPEAYRRIRDDFNAAIARLQETVRALVGSTREVASAAAEISTSTTDLSQRTEEQAASLERTSSAMEEIASTVRANAANAKQASEFATATREVADKGGAVVSEAVSAMSRIEESSRQIADIIGVIDEIARQTNLLALNAAVEAARAGDAGRGFAVVATEVRSLAQRSSQAAKDIKDLITNSSTQVKDGVDLVNRAGTSLTEIVESIKKVTSIVAEISTASAEQATGLDDITKSLGQMDEATQQNSALVEENAATAKTLEQQSRAMDEQVGLFRVDAGVGRTMAAPATAIRPAATPSKPAAVTAATPRPAGAQRRNPVGRMQSQLAAAVDTEQDWKEF
jgi:methyl-accepting chemotaxis protein